MALTLGDVIKIALSLEGVEEGMSYGTPALKAGGKLLARLKEDAETLVVGTTFEEREALMAEEPGTYFFTEHYRNYPWVLVRLSQVSSDVMRDLLKRALRLASAAPKRPRAAAAIQPYATLRRRKNSFEFLLRKTVGGARVIGRVRFGYARRFQMDDRQRYEQGMKTRRSVLGDAHVDATLKNRNEFTDAFQDFITRYAWGEIWSRPGLPKETRSMLTLAMMVALNRPDELRMHLRAALNIGVSREQIQEVLLQTAIYCGLPAANSAFHLAMEVFSAHQP